MVGLPVFAPGTPGTPIRTRDGIEGSCFQLVICKRVMDGLLNLVESYCRIGRAYLRFHLHLRTSCYSLYTAMVGKVTRPEYPMAWLLPPCRQPGADHALPTGCYPSASQSN
jgi:hypothetical protein